MTALLEVEGLTTTFPGPGKDLPIVDGVGFHIDPGEVLALVGESGCGKSMTALSLMRLIPKPGRISAGEIRLGEEELLSLSVNRIRRVRAIAWP